MSDSVLCKYKDTQHSQTTFFFQSQTRHQEQLGHFTYNILDKFASLQWRQIIFHRKSRKALTSANPREKHIFSMDFPRCFWSKTMHLPNWAHELIQQDPDHWSYKTFNTAYLLFLAFGLYHFFKCFFLSSTTNIFKLKVDCFKKLYI